MPSAPRSDPPVTPSDPRRVGLAVAVISLGLSALYFVLPSGGVLQSAVFVIAAVTAPSLLAVRLAGDGLLLVRPWFWLVAGTGLYGLATIVWGLWPAIADGPLPFPSPLDAVYFAAYAFSATFLVVLIRQRNPGSGDGLRASVVALLDAGILSIAVTALSWPGVIAPSLADPDVRGLSLVVALGYPLLTAVLAGLVARLAISVNRARPEEWLLLVWAAAELSGDIFYGHLGATGEFWYGHPISFTWLVSYVALGTLARNPDLTRLTDRRQGTPLGGWRVWVPLSAALVPVVVALLFRAPVVELLAGVAVVLLIARLRLMSGDLEVQRGLTSELAATAAELETVNQTLEHFASAASHDLRSPLATIHGLLETVEVRSGASLPEVDRELVGRARAQAGRMLGTIDGLLSLARIDAQPLAMEWVDLGELCDEVTDGLRLELDAAGARVEYGDLPTVPGDPVLLRLLLQNLVANAVKFRHPDRPPRVGVSAMRCGEHWRLQVVDDGRGFDASERAAIFDLFERSRGGEDVAGTGIGLATCRRIVERHGGAIRGYPNHPGARFVVTLPAEPRSGR